ncbi:peptidase M50 [Campylobacter concisus]|uniref:peptidase M50 n=1 Tax=Campylobacter concisus TaxID=199 RepID=UPI000D30E2ED|nr:peptidase M50 [Campylobacter concisus]
MLLNTYAPPFKLVGGYFIAGIFFLALSVPAFFYADFDAISSLNTAGFLHIFFVGFVMSIIIGALYQLTSVILEKPFFTAKGAILNLAIFCLSLLGMCYGMLFAEAKILQISGVLLFCSLAFFATTYALSFMDNEKRSFAAFVLFVSAIFLVIGITLGFCLLMILSGTLMLDFEMTLKFHVYFVLGFVFLVILGAASVLLPMFALAHDLKFTLSKASLACYILGGILLAFNENLSILSICLAALLFIAQALYILKKRVRKAYDYWNVNIVLSLVALLGAAVFIALGKLNLAAYFLIYGFLFAFIVAHLYKIAPFLIWYHYVAPFVGKVKVPLLDAMILKKIAYFGIAFNAISLLCYLLSTCFELEILVQAGMIFIALSIVLLSINIINIFRFTGFKG